MKSFLLLLISTFLLNVSSIFSQAQFEFCNNFIHGLSFITGQDEGIIQNLDDNFSWMKDQGYTHLRFFGIYPNGYHIFPSPTLDANGYPSDLTMETYLEIIVTKANEYDIIINFDGLEIIAESNKDTVASGYSYITEQEMIYIVNEILSTGVVLLSEEQFGGSYLQAIHSATSPMNAIHETTSSLWWEDSSYADEQLASVFSFYHYNQNEVDSIFSLGSFPPANLGNLHVIAEGAHYFNFPFSIAVGSFGMMETENWKNVLLFSQIQHQVKRFSIEDENTAFTIWDPNFNFYDDIGIDLLSYSNQSFSNRPLVNLVLDLSPLFSGTYYPSYYASQVSIPAIVNTFTPLGYRIVPTTKSVLPEADIYYLILTGGTDASNLAPLPDYVDSLLNSNATVFVHPAYGIPDENDASDWISLRNLFGLPSGNTETLAYSLPQKVNYKNYDVLWAGANLWCTPQIEVLYNSQINTTNTSVVLTSKINNNDIALILKNENKYLINSNVIHFESSYIFSDLMSGPINSPTMANIAISEDQALIFAEYDSEVNFDLPWSGTSHKIYYNSQGKIVESELISSNGIYTDNLERGELVILTDSSSLNINRTYNEILNFNIYPNPTSSKATLMLYLQSKLQVEISILDSHGRTIKTIVNSELDKGKKLIELDLASFQSGLYIVKLKTGSSCTNRKLFVVK